MPLPIIAALAWLIEAALTILAAYIRAVLVAYAIEYAWEFVKEKTVKWAREAMPELALYALREWVGLDCTYPLSPESFTAAINTRIGENIFTDITDEDAVREDIARFALRQINQAIPGSLLTVDDFRDSPSARKRLGRKLRVCVKWQLVSGLEMGHSELFPAPVIANVVQACQSGYNYTKHVNIDDEPHRVGREMAAWWRRHTTRIRERI